MAGTGKPSIDLADLAKAAKAAKAKGDHVTAGLIKSTVEAFARSKGAATEAEALASFIHEQ